MNAAHRLLWLLRALLGAVLLWSAAGSHALVPVVTENGFRIPAGSNTGVFATRQAACDAQVVNWGMPGWTTTGNYVTDGGSFCRINSSEGTQVVWAIEVASGSSCPANSTEVAGGCQCAAGYVEQGGQCVQNQCAAKLGQTTIVNWTAGWQRTPNDDRSPLVAANKPSAVQAICNAGCEQTFNWADACPECKSYVSQTPNSQGLYRVSVDFAATYTGQSCTQGPADAPITADNSKDPPCPGYVGEVNGVKGCYGTADKPVTTQPSNLPSGNPIIAGNPAAGPKPTSGEGSGSGSAGRTPSGGAGGSGGGPSSAAQGGKGNGAGGASTGSGTVGKPEEGKEQENCGAPGQPICAVKVDEKGTPDSAGVEAKNQTAIDKLNAKADEKETGLSTVTRVPEGGTGWGFVPQWLNSQDCTPWNLGTLPIIDAPLRVDICEIQPYAVLIMTFFWVVGTIFAITGMVGRVMGSGVA